MPDNLEKLTEEAERARARLIASGAEIRAKLSPAALTQEVESSVKAGASQLAASVTEDARRHSGLIIGAIAALGAAALLGRHQVFSRLTHSDNVADASPRTRPLYAQTDTSWNANRPHETSTFSLKTLFAALAPVAVGYFMGESTSPTSGKRSFLADALRSEPARQIWRSHFGDLQHKLVNSYGLPKMAATLMLGLTVMSELTKAPKD